MSAKRDEYCISGRALLGDPLEVRDVTVVVSDGRITAVEDETAVPDRWIIPGFFNAHTHIADTVAMDLPCSGTLEELVTPPHGLKHRILAETGREELITAMRASIDEMISGGTLGFADFREGGVEGVRLLTCAAKEKRCQAVILGREGGEYTGDGAGISSTRDIPGFETIAETMKKEGKLIAFHAGERDSADIDAALACEPDLLVHCTHATKSQLKQIADAGIPVALCLRSNHLLGVTKSSEYPPVKEMVDQGVHLLFGTDNVMFVQPDMMQEMMFCDTVYHIPPAVILAGATGGFPPAGISHEIRRGNWARFFTMDIKYGNLHYTRDMISSIVKRASSGRVYTKIFYE
jgi:cytosine/adenosine deaminase-related metal-dependent hydrolase